jgi:hypothetical protein
VVDEATEVTVASQGWEQFPGADESVPQAGARKEPFASSEQSPEVAEDHADDPESVVELL